MARIKQSETMVFDSRAKHTEMMVVLQSKLVSRQLLSPSFMSAQVLPLQCPLLLLDYAMPVNDNN
jgi:hypothetical protein